MNKRITLSDRKRTSELSPGSSAPDSKKQQLAELKVSLEDQPPAALEHQQFPHAPASAEVRFNKEPLSLEEMVAELTRVAEKLQARSRSHTFSHGLDEQAHVLMKHIASYVNQRAEQLERKGVVGKAKKMQCEALLYSLTESLKKKNIILPKVKLIEPQ